MQANKDDSRQICFISYPAREALSIGAEWRRGRRRSIGHPPKMGESSQLRTAYAAPHPVDPKGYWFFARKPLP
jgi:hypothetical protein